MNKNNVIKNKTQIFVLALLICIQCAISFSKVFEKNYTVTFIVFEEEYSVVKTDKGKLTLPDDPVIIGYTFNGWFINEDYKVSFNALKVKDVHTVYAKFTYVEHMVTFDFHGGSFNHQRMYIKNNDNINISVFEIPKKENHLFLGWYLEDKLFDFNTLVTSDITLTAKWSLEYYTITLYLDHKFDSKEIILMPVRSILEELMIPTKENYVFLGWYEIINTKIMDEEFNINIIPQNDIILVGKWQNLI